MELNNVGVFTVIANFRLDDMIIIHILVLGVFAHHGGHRAQNIT